jgi:hypothetical protein
MKWNSVKELEDKATQITGIDPIVDYEYQRMSYSKGMKGQVKQHRHELFKARKRVI